MIHLWENCGKDYYIDMFEQLMDLYEFDIYKVTNDEKKEVLKVYDRQGGNLGGIEQEEFNDYMEILDRMEAYHIDYIVEPLVESLWQYDFMEDCATWEDILKVAKKNSQQLLDDGDLEWDLRALDLIVNSYDLKGVKGE